ncbi:MAG TPA: hypothetical protein VL947_03465 [Cytophagales bacterium]|nr:hypothetical protein [Cytophagales bacterium]
MFNKALTYILLSVLVVNLMTYQLVYLQFKWQQKYISENLCVKKSIKNNACQGKCHLNKMTKATESDSQKLFQHLQTDFICHEVADFNIHAAFMCNLSFIPMAYGAQIAQGYDYTPYTPPDSFV